MEMFCIKKKNRTLAHCKGPVWGYCYKYKYTTKNSRLRCFIYSGLDLVTCDFLGMYAKNIVAYSLSGTVMLFV